MAILPDHLRPGLLVVFCGTAVGKTSASRGHYYAGSGNNFWRYLFEAGFTPSRFRPEDDDKVCEYGLGLTDLAKEIAANSDRGLRQHYRTEDFIKKITEFKPSWIAFHGKESAKVVAAHLGSARHLMLGPQSWSVGSSSAFVLPSASGSNRDPRRLEGKADRLDWFRELANAAGIGTKAT